MVAMGGGERLVMTLIAMVVVVAVVLWWGSSDGAERDGNGGSIRIVLRGICDGDAGGSGFVVSARVVMKLIAMVVITAVAPCG